MSHKNAWTVKLFLLALAVIAGGAIVTGLSAAATHPSDGGTDNAAASSASCARAPETPPADGDATTPSSPNDEPDGTAAACRRAPECSTDSDCDAKCGVGLGKCVHSNCPVRICKCH